VLLSRLRKRRQIRPGTGLIRLRRGRIILRHDGGGRRNEHGGDLYQESLFHPSPPPASPFHGRIAEARDSFHESRSRAGERARWPGTPAARPSPLPGPGNSGGARRCRSESRTGGPEHHRTPRSSDEQPVVASRGRKHVDVWRARRPLGVTVSTSLPSSRATTDASAGMFSSSLSLTRPGARAGEAPHGGGPPRTPAPRPWPPAATRVLLVDLRFGHPRGEAVEHHAGRDPCAAEAQRLRPNVRPGNQNGPAARTAPRALCQR
jgi:hypothetical protein